MTQRQISHPEGLPPCAAGPRARHIHDMRCTSAGGGHLVECCCRSTGKNADPDAALAEWRRRALWIQSEVQGWVRQQIALNRPSQVDG
ncbi:hypothetical protein [Stenotrophomonas sp. PA-6-5C]|jgi:hypothetical protein|uniref:hypothetical protein n=1 Tax=Stenotrophomonas sp. PA-6-5C TaxID=2665487 RepID=UPI001F318423|nr:hypothetical protein [Stenotrophomonas sp. PA-6-5C]